jgi:hypothetical protein
MFKFDRNNKEYVCKEAQINVNEVAFVCTPTKTTEDKDINSMKYYEGFQNNNSYGDCVDAVEKTGFIPRITWGNTPGNKIDADCDHKLCNYWPAKYPNGVPDKFKNSNVDCPVLPYTYLPLSDSAEDIGSNPQQSSAKGQTVFGIVGGKQAALFNNRLDTFVQVGNKTNNVFTVCFWIYKNDGGYYTAVSITDGNNPLLQFDVQTDRQVAYSALPNHWVHDGWSRAAVGPGAWYHVAYVCNNNEAALYINGNKDHTFRGSAPMNSSARPFWFIGRSGDSGRAFNGAIRHFAVWNSVLDDRKIKSFMFMTRDDNSTKPSSYLPLADSEKDVGSAPQPTSIRGETKFGVVAGKKAAMFNNKMETFITLNNKTNGTFTVMFWIYKNDGGNYTAVSITDGNNPLLQFDMHNDRQVAFSALPNPWVHDGWSKASVPPGAWYHVAYTVTGNEATLYINGNKDNSFRGSGPMNSAARPFWFIGRSGDSGRAFHGAIRQFAVWNSVVDENSIKDFMKKTEHDVDTTGIVKFVRIDSGGDYLQLSQVVVTDANGTNIAKGRKTSSSGVGWDGPEAAAVDGVEASRGHPAQYHSNGGNAFFQIELSSPSQIASVTIYNRADCCQGRLASGYRVRLLDSQGNAVFTSEPLNAEAKQVIKVTGPAGSRPKPPVFKKIECGNGEAQAGFGCYPEWLLNNSYGFTQGMDSGGHDIRRSGNANNIMELKKECDADPNCKGFNTNGFLKNVVKSRGEWYKWTDEPNKGFYVKN